MDYVCVSNGYGDRFFVLLANTNIVQMKQSITLPASQPAQMPAISAAKVKSIVRTAKNANAGLSLFCLCALADTVSITGFLFCLLWFVVSFIALGHGKQQ